MIDKVEIVWYYVNVRNYSKWIERWMPMQRSSKF